MKLLDAKSQRPAHDLPCSYGVPSSTRLSFFEYAKSYIIRGHFLAQAKSKYETELGFAGLAQLRSGAYAQGRLLFPVFFSIVVLFGCGIETWYRWRAETRAVLNFGLFWLYITFGGYHISELGFQLYSTLR
ncbi:MAG: hypothetical protein GWN00_28790 [Aliifodinibius sp.]|nr:hypothetical protein [Fodinibius sp.]NIY28654.1 hypothetical protein [Fodinibius sp.]